MSEMIERVAKVIRDSFNSNDIDCYPIACAVIEEMREPTEEMLKEADDLMDKLDNCGKSNIGFIDPIYQAMIDAALKD